MFKKIMMLLALAFSLASAVGAMAPNQQIPYPDPPPDTGP